ncbi:starch-binding protein [Bacteroidia bacterium]|nr:starch-binding protein [Bacteroidia bacterium]
MKKIKLIAILALCLSISCTDDLNLQPMGNANGEQIWTTAQGSEQMVCGAYARLRRILIFDRPMYVYGDLPSTALFTHNHWIAQYATQGNYVGSYLKSWWLNWSPYFQVITTTNTLLKHINDIPLSEFAKDDATALKKRNQIRGEAYFLYAYTYFYMVRIYGDVPLVKEAIESASQALENGSTVPRKQTPEKEVLEELLKRLDAAIVLLDFDQPGSTNWAVRADKSAALTLKAHVLLWLVREMDSSSPQYTQYVGDAEEALNTVIGQSGRQLVDYNDPSAVVKMFDGQSSEGIFELNVSTDLNESFHINADGQEFPLHTTTYRDVTRKPLTESNMNSMMVPDPNKAVSLYAANDKRRKLFFQNFGNAVKDYQAPPFLLKYAANLVDDPVSTERYFTNSNVLLFRLSEAILLRAEALLKLGRLANAKEMLNITRERAGIGRFKGSDSELMQAIFDERVRELAGEGHSAYDRIRNDYWDGNEFMTAERKSKKGYYWPVDIESLISANNELYQVPWWIGKL